jgi:hypothetical protein
VDGRLDWDCNGVLTRADSAPRAYKGWLATLARELLDEAATATRRPSTSS